MTIRHLGLGLIGLALSAASLLGAEPATAPAVVTYHAFGAVGDGTTDDFDAIIAAHRFANQHRIPVRAADGATYRIGAGKRSAEIRTSTDFGTAAFIIDDREVRIDDRKLPVFHVLPDHPASPVTGLASLRRDQARLPVPLAMRSLLFPVDAGTSRFIRHGGNRNSGNPQQDVVVVEADGTIDPTIPLLWDFPAVSTCTAQPIDAQPLTISGGRFTTIANQAPSLTTYFGRGLTIQRSNVTVRGVTHLITGEGESGAPYIGFLHVVQAAGVTIQGCVLSSHKTYFTMGSGGSRVGMGSYDLSIHQSVDVRVLNCVQQDDLFDDSHWAVMASNGSKNLLYDGCSLSRFDAHAGLVNATIRNSTVRHIAVTGWGTLRIEDSTIPNVTLVTLRTDYGSHWDGEVVIRNCTLAPPAGGKAGPIAVIVGDNDGRQDFGYPCRMGRRIDIDGLRILDRAEIPTEADPVILHLGKPGRSDAPHPYLPPEEVVTRGLTTSSGRTIALSNQPQTFAGVRWTKQ